MNYLYIIVLLSISLSFAQDGVYYLQGGISTEVDQGEVSSDLMYNGKKLTEEEALNLRKEYWNKSLDLSDLDPEPTQYWQNINNLKKNKITLKDYDEVEFVRNGIIGTGDSSIYVNHKNSFYELMMNEYSHKSLMMESTLRKLGYFIPELKKIKKLKLKFKTVEEKETFANYYNLIHFNSFDDKLITNNKWIDEVQESSLSIVLRDVLVRSNQDYKITNLALAPFLLGETRNRRSLSALLIPYSIFNLNSSLINTFEWDAGKIVSNNIFLDNDDAAFFGMSIEDGRWMLKKMSQLSISDWDEIVSSAQLPSAVQKIVLEKVKSRFNSLLKIFKVQERKLKVEFKPSEGVELVKGKLVKCEWEGYAQAFCTKNKTNILEGNNLWDFIKSRAFSIALDSAMSVLNDQDLFRTDTRQKSLNIIENLVEKALDTFEQTGEEQNILKESWNFNYYDFNLIFSRNLVTGRFQGSDQLMSLADSIGVSIGGGKQFETMGYNEFLKSENIYQRENNFKGYSVSPPKLQLGGNISRIYTHITPVTSIKEANRLLPFKKSVVPLVKNSFSRIFSQLHKSKKKSVEEEVASLQVNAAADMKKFKEDLKVGESFIITDTMNLGARGNLRASYQKIAELNVSGGVNGRLLGRTHIVRASPNQLHVYKSFGNLSKVSIGAQLASFSIPFTKAILEKNPGGIAKTKFYSIPLDEESNDVVDNCLMIRSLLKTGQIKQVKKKYSPLILKYKFNENLTRLGIFWFSHNNIKSVNNIEVTTPDGDSIKYLRFYDGKTNGQNAASYGSEVLGYILSKNTGFGISLLNSGLNPGLSISGKSKNYETVYEVQLDENDNKIDDFVKYTESRIGWKTTQSKMNQYITELEQKYNYDYFNDNALSETENILIYNLAVDFYVYSNGLKKMLELSEKRFEKIYKIHSQDFQEKKVLNLEKREDVKNTFLGLQNKYKKFEEKGNWKKRGKIVSKMMNLLTKHFNLTGLSQIWGGSLNFYTIAKVNGFREGASQNVMSFDSSIQSNSFGTLGEFFEVAPKAFNDKRSVNLSLFESSIYKAKWGITKGELYINWLLGRVY